MDEPLSSYVGGHMVARFHYGTVDWDEDPVYAEGWRWRVDIVHDHTGYHPSLSLASPSLNLTEDAAGRIAVALMHANALAWARNQLRDEAN